MARYTIEISDTQSLTLYAFIYTVLLLGDDKNTLNSMLNKIINCAAERNKLRQRVMVIAMFVPGSETCSKIDQSPTWQLHDHANTVRDRAYFDDQKT